MGHATWSATDTVAAEPERVYAWLTDLSADDHSSPAYKRGAGIPLDKNTRPSKREVLSREGNVLRVRDQWGRDTFEATVTFDPEARTVRIQGGFGYDSTWRVQPEGAGSRVSVEGQMGSGLFGTLMRLFAGKLQRSMENDFRGHMEDLRESLAVASEPA